MVAEKYEKYEQSDPRVVGTPDGSPPVLVVATGYGHGFNIYEMGWVTGASVETEIARGFFVPYVDGSGYDGVGVLHDPGMVRHGDRLPDLGIPSPGATTARVDALTADVSHEGTWEPDGPTSIHEDQSDVRPPARSRQRATADSTAIARSNAEQAQFTRNPNVADDDVDGTYDLDATHEPVTPAPRRRSR